jgi:hypothetical protein
MHSLKFPSSEVSLEWYRYKARSLVSGELKFAYAACATVVDTDAAFVGGVHFE